jgi:hypothetical protein
MLLRVHVFECKRALCPPQTDDRTKNKPGIRLRLIAQSLLMATLLHAFTPLVFGNFGLTSFLQRAHENNCRSFPSNASIQTSSTIGCNLLLHPEIVRIKQSFFEEDNQNADCGK